MCAKKLENRMGGSAIYIHLRKQLELNIMFRRNTVLNLCICARLLAQELVARKSQNLQAFTVIFTMQLIQLRIRFRRQPTFARDITHQHNLSKVHLPYNTTDISYVLAFPL
eukprot:GILK01003556.1.p1 GENE.GILK01003556.1~~GILK01003556.1.p1  ORF type:complete len:111 (-),score=0.21 GILK01003556.1:129-461(-)